MGAHERFFKYLINPPHIVYHVSNCPKLSVTKQLSVMCQMRPNQIQTKAYLHFLLKQADTTETQKVSNHKRAMTS